MTVIAQGGKSLSLKVIEKLDEKHKVRQTKIRVPNN